MFKSVVYQSYVESKEFSNIILQENYMYSASTKDRIVSKAKNIHEILVCNYYFYFFWHHIEDHGFISKSCIECVACMTSEVNNLGTYMN